MTRITYHLFFSRYHYPRYPRVFYVSLKVGQREFIGMGNSRQAARHDAASKALQVLQNLPMPTEADRQQMAAQQGEQAENDNKEDGQWLMPQLFHGLHPLHLFIYLDHFMVLTASQS